MRKIIAIMVILSMALVAIPAMAWESDEPVDEPQITTITTHTNVLGTGGGQTTGGTSDNLAPYIKVKWEYDMDDGYHDASVVSGLQVAPNLFSTRTVGYYAVVTDPNGRETVSNVYADVWHPDGSYKYQIELFKVSPEDKSVALGIWNHVYTTHGDLITVNEGWAQALPPEVTWWEDVYDELNEQLAYLYYGEAEISYCQPGGWYYVGVRAHDHMNLWGDYLCNEFWYIPTSAVEIDFANVDYSQEGPVAVSYERWIGGDYIMGTSAKPTVRNIGNCPVELWVEQDHMGFADTNGAWNVMFNARLTADGEEVYYYPNDMVQIPGILDMCTMEKLDFSIHVLKGFPDIDYTGHMDLYAFIDESSYIWNTPLEFIGDRPLGVPEVPPCNVD